MQSTAAGTVTLPSHPQGTMGVFLTTTYQFLLADAGTKAVAVAGAEVGDIVMVTDITASSAGWMSGSVTAANTVTITSTSVTDLSNVRIVVLKQP